MAFEINELVKQIREIYHPGSPYVPAEPGQSYRAAYCETIERTVGGGGNGGNDVYGCIAIPKTDGFGNITGTDGFGNITSYSWVCFGGATAGDGQTGNFSSPTTTRTYSERVCYPEVPYIAPVPAEPAIPSQVTLDYNLGWNAGAEGDEQLTNGNAFQFTIYASSTGAAVGVSDVFDAPSSHYVGMELCVMATKGTFAVMESGSVVVGYQPYSSGDVFRISLVDGRLFVTKNGGYVYDKLADAAIYKPDASFYSGGDGAYDGSIEVSYSSQGLAHSISQMPATAIAHVPDFAAVESVSTFIGVTGAVEVDSAVYTEAESTSSFIASARTAQESSIESISIFGTAGVAQFATGTISFADNPTEGDTITINDVEYTFTETPTEDTDIEIGSTLDETLENAAEVINGNDDDVTVVADTDDDELVITATDPGEAGNDITLDASDDTVSNDTLEGGTDGDGETVAVGHIGVDVSLSFEPISGVGYGPTLLNGGGTVTFEPMTVFGEAGYVQPTIGVGAVSFAYMTMAGHGLTGTVGGMDAEMEPMQMLASDGPYGSGVMAMEPMEGIGYEIPEFDGYMTADLPAITFDGYMSRDGEYGVVKKLPQITFVGQFGSQMKATLPALTIEAEMENEAMMRVDANLPGITFSGNMYSGAILTMVRPLPAITGYGQFGSQMTATLPRLEGESTVSAGNVLRLDAQLPQMTLVTEITQDGLISLNATLPVLEPTYGVLKAVLPSITFQGAIIDTPAEFDVGNYSAYAMNLVNDGMTSYANFGFDFIVRFEGEYLGINPDGVRLLEGDDDDGTDISAHIALPPDDFGTSQHKRMNNLYIGAESDGPLMVTATVDEGRNVKVKTAHTGRNRRAKIPKGLSGRFWGFKIENQRGQRFKIDSIESLPDVLRRKV